MFFVFVFVSVLETAFVYLNDSYRDRERETQRERTSVYGRDPPNTGSLQMTSAARAEPGWGWEPEASFRSPKQMVGAQALGPSAAAFPGALAGIWIRGEQCI